MTNEAGSTLAKKVVNSGLFYVVRLATRLLLAIALGKSLATNEYGVYSLIATSVGILGYLLQLGAHQYIMREVPGQSGDASLRLFKSVVGAEMAIISVILVVAVVVLLPMEPISSTLGGDGSGILIVAIAALLLSATAATELVRYLTARTRIEISNAVDFFQTGFYGLAIFLVYLVSRDSVTVTIVVLMWLVGTVTATVVGLRMVGLRALWRSEFRPRIYFTAVKFGIPLMVVSLAGMIMELSDRYFIAGSHSTEALGVYAFHYNVILMITAASAPLVGNVLGPYVVAAYNTNEPERSMALLNTSLRYQTIFLIPVLLVVSLWPGELIAVLASSEYVVAGNLMVYLVPIPMLILFSSIFVQVLVLQRRTVTIGAIFGCAGLLNLALNFFLVPLHPFYGAAVATDISMVMLDLALLFSIRRSQFRISLPVVRMALAAALAAGAAWPIVTLVSPESTIVLLALACSILLAVYAAALFPLRIISSAEVEVIRRTLKHFVSYRAFPSDVSSRS